MVSMASCLAVWACIGSPAPIIVRFAVTRYRASRWQSAAWRQLLDEFDLLLQLRRRAPLSGLCAAVAGSCTSFEDRPNALDGRRRLDGPDYRPFSDVTISQVGIRRGQFCAHRIIPAVERRTRFPAEPAGPVPET